MNRKRSSVDRLVANDDLAVLVDEDEVRDADGCEVLREGVQPWTSVSVEDDHIHQSQI